MSDILTGDELKSHPNNLIPSSAPLSQQLADGDGAFLAERHQCNEETILSSLYNQSSGNSAMATWFFRGYRCLRYLRAAEMSLSAHILLNHTPVAQTSTSQVGVYPTETQPDSDWSDSSDHREVSDLWGGESLAGNIRQRSMGNARG